MEEIQVIRTDTSAHDAGTGNSSYHACSAMESVRSRQRKTRASEVALIDVAISSCSTVMAHDATTKPGQGNHKSAATTRRRRMKNEDDEQELLCVTYVYEPY